METTRVFSRISSLMLDDICSKIHSALYIPREQAALNLIVGHVRPTNNVKEVRCKTEPRSKLQTCRIIDVRHFGVVHAAFVRVEVSIRAIDEVESAIIHAAKLV